MMWSELRDKLARWAELLGKEGANTKNQVKEEIEGVILNIDQLENNELSVQEEIDSIRDAAADTIKEAVEGWF